MITHIYGTDTYRVKEYLKEHAAGAIIGEDGLKMQGLFDQAPVILYDPPAKTRIPEDLEVFIVSEKPVKRTGGSASPGGGKLKAKNAVELNILKGAEIISWIKSEAKRQGFAIDAEAVKLLAQNYRDTWQTKLTLDMLCNYAADATIRARDVTILAPTVSEEKIFDLTDAIAGRQKGQAVVLLSRQLEQGSDPYYLFSMIVGQFRNMIAPKRAGVHPYASGKAAGFAKRFQPGELPIFYRRLSALEHGVKGGEYDITDGLYKFIFSL
ncbi:MAG: hypothetical protein AAB483_00910 [Patescibacteria group bacterium]